MKTPNLRSSHCLHSLVPVLVLLLTFLPLPSALASASYLRLHGRFDPDDLYCESWRFAVETNDMGSWDHYPPRCFEYVRDYFNGPLYLSDCEYVAEQSIAYARSAVVNSTGMDAWIFDVDDTLLSTVPYEAAHGHASEDFNGTAFEEWAAEASAPALPSSLKLYNELRRLGVHIFLIPGRREYERKETERNLKVVGYSGWAALILRSCYRGPSDIERDAVDWKSEKRAEIIAAGYTIIGNSGDQWSDLYGTPMARRSFKLPNPMYHLE